MKKIILLFFIFILSSCKPYYYENKLIIRTTDCVTVLLPNGTLEKYYGHILYNTTDIYGKTEVKFIAKDGSRQRVISSTKNIAVVKGDDEYIKIKHYK